ncbi:MAG: radical SAM protein [Promethearchaeota archaeon]
MNKKNVFGTHEWADKTANCINGCKHDCKYCYSKSMAIRFKRKTSENWKIEEVREHQLIKKYSKYSGTYMYPSSHDIHPDNLNANIQFLNNLLISGNQVLIVSKPHFECIKRICNEFSNFKNQILFRFTIGSANSEVLKYWEPGAPDFKERLKCLKFAFENGFETSISCEPMLDSEINKVIDKVLSFTTDAIWLGKANFLLRRLKMNGYSDKKSLKKANELIHWQSDNNMIELYEKYKDNSKIKWKESIKKIVGLILPSERGLDI